MFKNSAGSSSAKSSFFPNSAPQEGSQPNPHAMTELDDLGRTPLMRAIFRGEERAIQIFSEMQEQLTETEFSQALQISDCQGMTAWMLLMRPEASNIADHLSDKILAVFKKLEPDSRSLVLKHTSSDGLNMLACAAKYRGFWSPNLLDLLSGLSLESTKEILFQTTESEEHLLWYLASQRKPEGLEAAEWALKFMVYHFSSQECFHLIQGQQFPYKADNILMFIATYFPSLAGQYLDWIRELPIYWEQFLTQAYQSPYDEPGKKRNILDVLVNSTKDGQTVKNIIDLILEKLDVAAQKKFFPPADSETMFSVLQFTPTLFPRLLGIAVVSLKATIPWKDWNYFLRLISVNPDGRRDNLEALMRHIPSDLMDRIWKLHHERPYQLDSKINEMLTQYRQGSLSFTAQPRQFSHQSTAPISSPRIISVQSEKRFEGKSKEQHHSCSCALM